MSKYGTNNRHFRASYPAVLFHFVCLVSVLLAGCSPTAVNTSPSPAVSTTSPPSQPPSTDLGQRPLTLPSLAVGQPCPRASGQRILDQFGAALGKGPAYPVGLGSDGILQFEYPPPADTLFAGSEWSGNKVLWVVAPSYQGDVLVRGGRLDRDEPLRFDEGSTPPSSLIIEGYSTSETAHWRERPSFTRVRAPGCYAYQVDGDDFSYTIVFEARVSQ